MPAKITLAYEEDVGCVRLPFEDVARLAADEDNCAIATRTIAGGSVVLRCGISINMPITVLEGHRFAVEHIARGQPLLSWATPFAIATRDIVPGEWTRNPRIIDALRLRGVPFKLPKDGNFRDDGKPFTLDEGCEVVDQIPLVAQKATFEGFPRSGGRGTGTRNYVVVIGVTSRTASFVRAVAAECDRDVVVPVAHTEAGGQRRPNNWELVRRTLSGFIVHPNVGAAIVVDLGDEVLTGDHIRSCYGGGRKRMQKSFAPRVQWASHAALSASKRQAS